MTTMGNTKFKTKLSSSYEILELRYIIKKYISTANLKQLSAVKVFPSAEYKIYSF